jgi:ArsR family transcriptional regulator
MKLLEKDEDINKATKALKAMAHPLRLKILCVLKSDELPKMTSFADLVIL